MFRCSALPPRVEENIINFLLTPSSSIHYTVSPFMSGHKPLSSSPHHILPPQPEDIHPGFVVFRAKSAPNLSPHPFPSPPLSVTASPTTHLPTHDPWLEPSHIHSGMDLSASTSSVGGLDGAWRSDGRGKERESGSIWDARETRETREMDRITEGERRIQGEKIMKVLGGSLPEEGFGPLPVAVLASVMDTSKGRDKVLVRLRCTS